MNSIHELITKLAEQTQQNIGYQHGFISIDCRDSNRVVGAYQKMQKALGSLVCCDMNCFAIGAEMVRVSSSGMELKLGHRPNCAFAQAQALLAELKQIEKT